MGHLDPWMHNGQIPCSAVPTSAKYRFLLTFRYHRTVELVMPHMDENENATSTQSAKEPKKLILCFDGTGNTFSGSNADTNVVKLLSKLDRNHPDQFHYYQSEFNPTTAMSIRLLVTNHHLPAGIGTYGVNETSVNKTWIGEVRSSVSQSLDQGFGTTFDAHVMAGYRFLMRYYVSVCN